MKREITHSTSETQHNMLWFLSLWAKITLMSLVTRKNLVPGMLVET